MVFKALQKVKTEGNNRLKSLYCNGQNIKNA
uniref:Uncharacterized protein n=1 Tax=Anguilla anguilla TaxID=7936 RepID=A0A0E9SXC7_ANGAN